MESGSELMAERQASKSMVHVDWLRFTVRLRNAPPFLVDRPAESSNVWDDGYRLNKLLTINNQLPDCERNLCGQATDLADRVCQVLGFEFNRGADVLKGHDFYKHRWSIQRNGAQVGWVGFGASSESPKKKAQAESLHVNLYGVACTFADYGWSDRMANIIDDLGGKITRADLALDFFDGFSGGIERVAEEWKESLCDNYGHRPVMRDINWLKAG